MDLSIVIPVYNEEQNVALLHGKILSVCHKLGSTFEVVFVNDGSNDKTLEELKKLRPVKIINFSKNFGQTAALDAGIKHSEGKIIITMDGDLQNDPEDIPNLLSKLKQGYDVVSGWRVDRKDCFLKNVLSKGAHKLRQFLIADGIHDSGCTLKAYKRECFEGVDLYGEMHRFIPALLQIRGYRIGEVAVQHHPRIHSTTKYTYKRLIKGIVDLVSVWFWQKYSNRPLHLFGTGGFFLVFFGILTSIYLIIGKIWFGRDLSDTALTPLAVLLLLAGLQLFIFGILADILVKTYYKTNHTRPYNVKEIIKNNEDTNA